MAKPEKRLRGEIYSVRCGRTVVAADPGSQDDLIGIFCPGGCPPAGEESLMADWEDKGPVADPTLDRRRAPAWVAQVRENTGSSPVGPPPLDIPAAVSERFNLDKPFVELTLRETGRYTGPTKGRVVGETVPGFRFLTLQGLYFIAWSNLAFWTYLAES